MDKTNNGNESDLQHYLKVKVSRAQLLTAAGAGLALAAVPGAAAAGTGGTGGSQRLAFPFFPQVHGAYTPENVMDILNVLDTLEQFFVTANVYALTDPTLVLDEPWLSLRQAKAAIGQYHIDYLESLGAHSLLTTFTPRNKVTAKNPIGSFEGDSAIVAGAYMTAAREFAELGQPLLVKNAFQAGAVWAETRGIARALLAAATTGSTAFSPPLNKAFATDHFVYTRDIYKFFVEGKQFENSGTSLSGLRLTYQGRDAVLAAAGPMANAVIQKTPNNAVVSTSGAMVAARGNDALTGERGDTGS